MNTFVTTVYQRSTAKFDMTGKFLGYNLHETGNAISPGLAQRLVKYAMNRMVDNGFVVDGYVISVSTNDGDLKPAKRDYHVSFTNDKGGQITVACILTKQGWPFLDHGFEIATGQ